MITGKALRADGLGATGLGRIGLRSISRNPVELPAEQIKSIIVDLMEKDQLERGSLLTIADAAIKSLKRVKYSRQ